MAMSVYFEDHSIEADHGRRSLRAGAVNFSARVLITVVQLLTLLVSRGFASIFSADR
jgi:hypothetical protein